MPAKKRKTSTTKKKASSRSSSKSTTIKSSAKKGRTDQRIPIQLLVDYRADGSYLFDFCKDLGTGGIFIQTEKPLPQGSNIDLTFTIPDSKETLQTKGEVIWVQEENKERKLTPGMGVQFTKFDGRQRQVLEKFVTRYHGDKFLASGKQSA